MTPLTTSFLPDTRRRIPPLVDVWLPDGPGPHKNAVIAHGGGFVLGSRSMSAVTHTARRLVGAGWAVCCYDYRLIFRGGRLDEAMRDTRDAIGWWRDQAGRFDLDLDRTALVGLSAGAALVQLAAPEVGRVHKVVNLYGPTDFRILPGWRSTVPQRVLMRSAAPADWHARSPFLRFDLPVPYLVQAGTRDRLISPGHARAAEVFRRERGLPIEVQWYEAGHGWLRRPDHPVFEPSLGALLAFLDA